MGYCIDASHFLQQIVSHVRSAKIEPLGRDLGDVIVIATVALDAR